MTSRSIAAFASAVAFTVLAAVLVGVGAVPWIEGLSASIAVAAAFVPTGWWGGGGVRRRLAEASLLPAAFALTMVGGAIMRRMLLPPLLLLAIWAVAAAAWDRVPADRRPVLAALMGLAARAAVGLGLAGFSALEVVLALAVSAVLPWMALKRWGRRAAENAALFGAVLPWQSWPLAAGAVVCLSIALGVVGAGRNRDDLARRWIPGLGAVALLAAALAAWPGLGVRELIQGNIWIALIVLHAALLITTRLHPGIAGAVWLAASLAFGPVQAPSPEQRPFVLSQELGELVMSAGTGGTYVVDLDIQAGGELDQDTPVAVLRFAGSDHPIAAGPAETVWRPRGAGARTRWKAVARSSFVVPDGDRPLLFRHPDLAGDVRVRVETIGAVRPTPPRDWMLSKWLLAAAAAVVVIGIASGTWRSTAAAVPWLLLVAGSLVARSPVEPLRLLGERLAVDLALAALLAAWLPAARVWLRRRQIMVTVAAVLVPLALATPHLTPPLYGDEPFHLVVMESLAGDRDLDIADDLDLERHPQNELYAPGWPLFQSPVLSGILLPGYVIGGRSGALALLALMGAALIALTMRRARQLGLREPLVQVVVLVLALTYPVATYSTQIWPELPGALAVATLLVLAARARGGRAVALAVAVIATSVKTRLGLLTLPVAAAVWLRRRPLRGLLILALGAGAALVIGWLTMGHPFGPYRRLHDLLPTDPALAVRVLGGLAFDAAGGLAFTAPLFLAALAGASTLWQRGGVGERFLLVGCSFTLVALLHSPEWYGGGAPPARYLVPMLPAFALAGSLMVTRRNKWRRILPMLLPPSLMAWWALISRPHLSVNPGDGGFWLADALSRRFAADGRSLFPSFLVWDAATLAVPLASLVAAATVVWLVSRRTVAVRVLAGAWVAVWLAAAAGLVLTLGLRTDSVVEAEAPQVRRSGGRPVPPAGTVSRYSHRRGWRLDNGDRITVPLNLRDGAAVVVEGWHLGTARKRGRLEIVWDQLEPVSVVWRGDGETTRLSVPPPPGPGRHRLGLTVRSRPKGAIVLDRVVVESAGAQQGH